MRTNWHELRSAVVGAFFGVALPLALHWQAARVGDTEAWGMPLAAFALPGFFLGAILGAYLARPK